MSVLGWVLLAIWAGTVVARWLMWRRGRRFFKKGDVVRVGGMDRRITKVNYGTSTITVDRPFTSDSASVVEVVREKPQAPR